MKAIMACERNGGVGLNGSMPWPKDEKDLARFKELTLNKTVLMGRGTWESTGMPKPLPNRFNIILSNSRQPLFDILDPTFNSVEQIWDLETWLLTNHQSVWAIGGANLINSVWDQIEEFHLSHLRAEYECDTHIDLTRLHKDFKLTRSQICLTHNYEIWKRKS